MKSTNFHFIGTGLQEYTLTAAASCAGKTVLQIHHESFYGSHFASPDLKTFTTFLRTHSHSQPQFSPSEIQLNSTDEFSVLPLATRPHYFSLETTINSPEILEKSEDFRINSAGPSVLLSANSMTDLMSKMGMEKVELQGEEPVDEVFQENEEIPEEDLESPFVEFLSRKIGGSPRLKTYRWINSPKIMLYAISMADCEQENVEVCKDVLRTKDGIDRFLLYHSSIGRFPNAPGAMRYPIRGQGQLPESFRFSCCCERDLSFTYYGLSPVVGLLADKHVGNYKGVKLVSGHELFSHQQILDPSFILPSKLPSTSHSQNDGYHDSSLRDANG
ncbi:hypothetical protein ACH5RR_011951 [Cinchona calisaya]|uniref:Uncharacterized protein n=1 Tax=Cinchona calisaya TaxID=153742 RepID=A0ABD3A9Y6_9GENT